MVEKKNTEKKRTCKNTIKTQIGCTKISLFKVINSKKKISEKNNTKIFFNC